MSPSFEFATAGQVVFGPGSIGRLEKLAAGLGTKTLLVTGKTPGRGELAASLLCKAGISVQRFQVLNEPTVAVAAEGSRLALAEQCDLVVATGGGSAIDCGKAIAALMRNAGDLADYLEVIGRGLPLKNPSVPFVAIPTTAGTGSEVTRNAVLGSPEHKVKVSLRSPYMLPTIALVDPELTLDLPPDLTAATGLDALTQLIEPFVCARANLMTDALCRDGIRLAAQSLETAYREGNNLEARTHMAMASVWGGMALANAGLGAVHGFAGPIGGMYSAPHGALCAALLPHVLDTNLNALRSRSPMHPALPKFGEIARLLTGEQGASPEQGIEWIRGLVRRLGIPGLAHYGIEARHFPEIIGKASRASSMKANPLPLESGELQGILEQAL